MADWAIPNLTTAVVGIASTALSLESTTGTQYSSFIEKFQVFTTTNGTRNLGSINITDIRTLYLPDSRKFIDTDVNRPASGQLYPRFNK
jgi:hypothetical protein